MRQATPATITPDGAESAAGGEVAIASARRTLDLEIAGLSALRAAIGDGLGAAFSAAVALICASRGRVIVTGIGKSGHVGQKLAATLASTGTPAYFVHPSEASHGDLGMITPEDVVLALSWSGETAELKNLVTYSRRFAVPLIAVTSRPDSSLGQAADVVLALPRAQEACPHGLAPTTSTAMQLVVGDCLAIALLEGKGFSAADFKILHPGGQLGQQLLHVSDIMHGIDRLPLVHAATPMAEAIVVMTTKSFGCAGIVDGSGRLVGIITDGDLRRHMTPDLMSRPAEAVMTRSPKTIGPRALAAEALAMMNMHDRPFTALFVVEDERPIGLIHVHDLLRTGVA